MNFSREGCTRKNVVANWDLGTAPSRLIWQHRKPIKFVCVCGGGVETAPGDYNECKNASCCKKFMSYVLFLLHDWRQTWRYCKINWMTVVHFKLVYGLVLSVSLLYISIATCISGPEFNKVDVQAAKEFRQHRGRIWINWNSSGSHLLRQSYECHINFPASRYFSAVL